MSIKPASLAPVEFRIAGFYTPEELSAGVPRDESATGAIHEIRKQLENHDSSYDLDIIELMRRVNSHALAVLAALDSKSPITDIHFVVVPAEQIVVESLQAANDINGIADVVDARMTTAEGSVRWALKAKEPVIGLRGNWLSGCVTDLRKYAGRILEPKKK